MNANMLIHDMEALNNSDIKELNTLKMLNRAKEIDMLGRQLVNEKTDRRYYKCLQSALGQAKTESVFNRFAKMRRDGNFQLDEEKSLLTQIYFAILILLVNETALSEFLSERALDNHIETIIKGEIETEEFIKAMDLGINKSAVTHALFDCLVILSNISIWSSLNKKFRKNIHDAEMNDSLFKYGKARYFIRYLS